MEDEPPDRPVIAVGLSPADVLRLPDPAAGGTEALLAAANERRVDDARQRLASVFDPVDVVAGSRGAAEPRLIRVQGLPTAEEVLACIDDLLVYEDMRLPHLTFELTGAATDDAVAMRTNYDVLRPDVAEVAAKLQAGAALHLRWVDEHHEPLWDLCADLEAVTGVTCRVSAFIGPSGCRPLPEAPSDADRIVVPLDGPATISVEGRSKTDFETPLGAAVIVPVGAPTELTTEADGIHLLIDVGRAWPSSLVGLAAADAAFFPLLRADVPAVLDAPIRSYGGALYGPGAEFGPVVSDVMAPRAFERAAAVGRSELPHRAKQRLTEAVGHYSTSDAHLRASAAGGVQIAQGQDRWFAVLAGHRLEMDPESLHAIAPHLDGRDVGASRLAAAIAPVSDDADALVESLVAAEVFEVRVDS